MTKLEAHGSSFATSVEQHDHEQIEFCFDYALGSTPGNYSYRIDAYVYVPRNVGVTRHNYSKGDFYADVTPYMRLQAEPVPLEQLADPSAPASPLFALDRAVAELGRGETPPSLPLVVPVKFYAYLFAEAVKREARQLRRRLRQHPAGDAASADAIVADFSAALDRIRAALRAFRAIRTRLWPFEPVCHQELIVALRVADEYMSLYIDERLSLSLLEAGERKRLHDGTCLVARLRLVAARLADEEARFRRKYGYARLRRTDGAEGEFFTYYSSYLKKSVQNALYIETRDIESDDVYLRHGVAAAGAALAALWAFATRLPNTIADLSPAAKFAIVVGAVLAYVLKDRIKNVVNESLVKRLRKFDHKARLQGPAMEAVGLGMLRLGVREVMRFLRPDQVPPAVHRMRLARRTVRRAVPFAEEVIHYRKVITFSVEGDEGVPPGFWLHDILRLNVRHFLVRLDDSVDRQAHFAEATGGFAWAELHKVYHLNMLLAIGRIGPDGQSEEQIDHMRIVLDKNGVVRIDPVHHLLHGA